MKLSTAASSSERMQLYQQTVDTCFRFPDAIATTVATSSSRNNLSPSSSFVAGDHFTPKGCISKPIRRRSRTSRRTPTTVLNADAKSFRSLVQKFTGCRRRSSSTSFSFGNTRGPGSVNINFALGLEQDHLISNDHGSIIGQNDCSPQSQQPKQPQQPQKEEVSKGEEECDQFSFEFDSIMADNFPLTLSCFPSAKDDM